MFDLIGIICRFKIVLFLIMFNYRFKVELARQPLQLVERTNTCTSPGGGRGGAPILDVPDGDDRVTFGG